MTKRKKKNVRAKVQKEKKFKYRKTSRKVDRKHIERQIKRRIERQVERQIKRRIEKLSKTERNIIPQASRFAELHYLKESEKRS